MTRQIGPHLQYFIVRRAESLRIQHLAMRFRCAGVTPHQRRVRPLSLTDESAHVATDCNTGAKEGQ
jgi:hypothetical protein